MNTDSTSVRKLEYIALLAIVMLAFCIAFIPNRDYPYPVHIDEWQHMMHSRTLLDTGHIRDVSDPFSGISALSLGQFEAGFQLFCGMLHEITGISWNDIVRLIPSAIFGITVLSVYCLTRRQGFGLEAAFATCLIPTTVGILGPAFLVPVAMGLLFIPLMLFIAFNLRTLWSYVLMFICTCALLWIHPPSALAALIILFLYSLLALKDDFRHVVGLAISMAVPFLSALYLAYDYVIEKGISRLFTPDPLPAFHELSPIVSLYGYIPTGLCILGAFILGIRGGVKNISLIMGLLAMALLVGIYHAYGFGHHIMYLRGMLYTMLMMSIVGGAGLMVIRKLRLHVKQTVPFITSHMGKFIYIALVIAILVVALPARKHTDYYHMINRNDYRAFVWIEDNLNNDYQRAILNPWKGIPFAALTRKDVYSQIVQAPTQTDWDVYEFLGAGCVDTDFLWRERISIVYNSKPCRNPDLVEVTQGVYILPISSLIGNS